MSERPSIIVISSHVARGSVGNRAAVFALEAFAYPVWAIPTILLPWHPGHGPATRIVHDDIKFANFLNDISDALWIDEVGAILTGYMANAQQAIAVSKLVAKLKARNPNVIHVCDPVIGDTGGLYVPEDTAGAIRDYLLPKCDVTTPNRFELAWLLDAKPADDLATADSQARELGLKTVLVTSISNGDDGQTGNLLLSDNTLVAQHKAIANPPNGPGDLTAATFLAHMLDGIAPDRNLGLTTASVLEILQASAKRKSNELTLESDVASLINPSQVVEVRSLGEIL